MGKLNAPGNRKTIVLHFPHDIYLVTIRHVNQTLSPRVFVQLLALCTEDLSGPSAVRCKYADQPDRESGDVILVDRPDKCVPHRAKQGLQPAAACHEKVGTYGTIDPSPWRPSKPGGRKGQLYRLAVLAAVSLLAATSRRSAALVRLAKIPAVHSADCLARKQS